jgi:t-SNARE complex subunit (syntaxin)
VRSEHKKHDLKDFNTVYDEHSSELICHVSAIDNINQDLTSKEKEINQILTKEEDSIAACCDVAILKIRDFLLKLFYFCTNVYDM